ncbi:hypothetical protein [Paenibacillus borealis]|nr:hypothetical protein [Paenibacillus borealis]
MMKVIRFFFILTFLFIVGCNNSNSSKQIATTPSVPTSTKTTLPTELPKGSSSTGVNNYSDDEILSFVLKYSDLNETTVKLKDWPDTNEDEEQLSDPIYFVVVEKRPDNKSNEVDQRDYYSIYFGENYGDHIARSLRIFVKYDLSEIVLSEAGYFDEQTEVIYP